MPKATRLGDNDTGHDACALQRLLQQVMMLSLMAKVLAALVTATLRMGV